MFWVSTMLQIIQKHDMVNSERLEIFVMSVHWGTEVLKKCYGMNKWFNICLTMIQESRVSFITSSSCKWGSWGIERYSQSSTSMVPESLHIHGPRPSPQPRPAFNKNLRVLKSLIHKGTVQLAPGTQGSARAGSASQFGCETEATFQPHREWVVPYWT